MHTSPSSSGQRHWIFSLMLALQIWQLKKQTNKTNQPSNSHCSKQFPVIAAGLNWFRQRELHWAVVFIISPICGWNEAAGCIDVTPSPRPGWSVHKRRNRRVMSIKTEVRSGRDSGDRAWLDSQRRVKPSARGTISSGYGDRTDRGNRSYRYQTFPQRVIKLLCLTLHCFTHFTQSVKSINWNFWVICYLILV